MELYHTIIKTHHIPHYSYNLPRYASAAVSMGLTPKGTTTQKKKNSNFGFHKKHTIKKHN